MHVLVGYVIDGKSNGIDKYLLHMLDVMKQEDISFFSPQIFSWRKQAKKWEFTFLKFYGIVGIVMLFPLYILLGCCAYSVNTETRDCN